MLDQGFHQGPLKRLNFQQQSLRVSFKNTFFRNLLRTLEIYYIPSAAKEEKLQVQKQPIFLAAENDAVY